MMKYAFGLAAIRRSRSLSSILTTTESLSSSNRAKSFSRYVLPADADGRYVDPDQHSRHVPRDGTNEFETTAGSASIERSTSDACSVYYAERYRGTAKRNITQEVSLDAALAQSSQRLGSMMAESGPSPSQQAARRELDVLLANVLARLPEDYRDVLIFRHLENLSHEEIATRMNRSPGAVRMLLVRALSALRDACGQEIVD